MSFFTMSSESGKASAPAGKSAALLLMLVLLLLSCETKSAVVVNGKGAASVGRELEQEEPGSRARETLKQGVAHYKQGDIEEAVRTWTQALRLSEASGQDALISSALSNLGMAYLDLGEWLRASDCFERALSRAEEQKDPNRLRDALRRSGLASSLLGDYQEARNRFERAVTLDRQLGSQEGGMIDLNYLANVNWQTGNYAKALSQYTELGERAQRAGNAKREADARVGAGLIHEELGRREKAAACYQAAIETYRKRKEGTKGEAIALNNLGFLENRMGNHEEALTAYERALDIFRGNDDLRETAMVSSNIGEVYAGVQDLSRALDRFDQALVVQRKIGDKRGEAVNLVRRGKVYEQKGEDEQAEADYRNGLSLAEEIGIPETIWRASYRLGRLHEEKGDLKQALEDYDKSVCTIRSMADLLPLREDREGLLGGKVEVYDSLIRLLFKLQGTEKESRTETRALAACEEIRGLKRMNRFDSLDKPFQDPKRQALLDTYRLLRARIRRTEELLVRERTQQQPNGIERPGKDLEKLHAAVLAEYRGFTETLKVNDPSFSIFTSFGMEDDEQIRKRLEHGEAILEYYLAGDGRLYAFVTTSDGLIAAETMSVNAKELDADISLLRRCLQDPGLEYAPMDPKLPMIAKKLYKVLIRPLEPYLQDIDKLGILRNSKLHYVPFQALIRQTEDGDRRFLIEDYSIYYLTSRTLWSLEREEHREKTSSLSFGAFGNPDGTLPDAEKEVLEVSGHFPDAKVFVRSEATEGDLKKSSSRYGILHLATHGELDSRRPEASFLRFSPGRNEDGVLCLGEIYGLDLAGTNLVTLSACETAIGESSMGEEIVAFSEAFLFAGAPTVVATLWRVNDSSTALLMDRYYAHLQSGRDKLRALRLAQIDVMRTQEWDEETELPVDYSHPYFWSPFILIGDRQ